MIKAGGQAWSSPAENMTSRGVDLELDPRGMSEVRARPHNPKFSTEVT